MDVQRFTPEQWYAYAESAYALVFGEHRDPWCDRISYALLAHDGDNAIGYVTCRELDHESVYWQFGGALKEYRGVKAVRGLEAFLTYAEGKYKRITGLVENNNVQTMTIAMKKGFRVIGIRNINGKILLEMLKEF